MKNNETKNSSGQALAGAFADLSDLFRSATTLRARNPEISEPVSGYRKEPYDGSPPVVDELDVLLREAAVKYQQLEREARSLLGEEVALPSIVPALPRLGASKELGSLPQAAMAAMVSLFGRASATLRPVAVRLAGRLEAGEIAIYEPYERGFHPVSARTSIGTLSGDWVRKRSDGIVGTPDIALDLEYAHGDSDPQVIVELTWVGREAVTASGGTSWTTTPVPSDGETIASRVTSLAMAPVDGWVKLPLTVAASSTMSMRYDVWMRTTPGTVPAPAEDEDLPPIVLIPTPLPVPVPSPTPTGIPNDFFAALDPDRWRKLDDRLGQFIRDTVGAFEGVLSRVDILTDRMVLRDVSTALRERLRG